MHNKDNFYIQCAYRLICICFIVFILIAKLNKGGGANAPTHVTLILYHWQHPSGFLSNIYG